MGFKSFPDRTSLTLTPGLSAVVGPNGCGKSNLVDAVRWVMGEQSPKQLRGGKMEDVLFNGSQGRGPSPLAEVSLTLASEEPGPAGPTEFEITRRLFRSGDSEYLINRVSCRLKDVNQFFMDTGMGARAYAIIEQGRVNWLVDARPEERRILIDEAAGITRYKAQRKEAERRLGQAAENMARLSLVMEETKKQLAALNRAAARALKHRELKEQLKGLELELAARHFLELAARKTEVENRRAENRRELDLMLAETSQAELTEASLKLELETAEKTLEKQLAAWHEVQAELKAAAKEAEYLTAQQQQAFTAKERLKDDLEQLAGELGRAAADSERLGRELEETCAGLAKAEENLAKQEEGRLVRQSAHEALAARHGRAAAELSARQTERLKSSAAADSARKLKEHQGGRLEAAKREQASLEAESLETARRISELAAGQRRLADSLAELVQEEETWREEGRIRQNRRERLRDLSQARQTSLAAAQAKLETLAGFKSSGAWFTQGLRELMNSPDFKPGELIGPLAEHLQVPAGFEKAAENALGERLGWLIVKNRRVLLRALAYLDSGGLGRCGFILADELEDESRPGPAPPDYLAALLGPGLIWADTLAEAEPSASGQGLLSRSGAYLAPRGWGVGGHTGQDQGLLSLLKELADQTGLVERLEKETESLSREMDEAAGLLEEVTETVAGLKSRRVSLEAERGELSREQAGFSERQKALRQRALALEKEESLTRSALDGLSVESAEAELKISRLAEAETGLAAEISQFEAELAASRGRLEESRGARQEALLALNTLGEQRKRLTADWARVKNDIPAKTRLKEQRRADLAQGDQMLERLAERLERLAEEASEGPERLAEAEQAVSNSRLALDHLRVGLKQTETALKEARRKREELFSLINQEETEALALKFELDKLSEHLLTQWRVIFGPAPPPFEASSETPAAPLIALAEAETSGPPQAPTGGRAAPDLNRIDITPPSPIIYLEPETLAGRPLVAGAAERREELKEQLRNLGEVSFAAISEQKALSDHYDDYRRQYADLQTAAADLEDSIAKINRTCRLRFTQTFKEADAQLRLIFPVLFEGGEGFLSLTNSDDPLECGVEIKVQPPGKKLTLMSLLSGGEKALTALALIFALYLIKPSPFCLLDETDAPLDEANIDRFNRLLQKLTQSSQVILITHNKRTMQISQKLYGVTMESPGISKLVSVDLAEMDKNMELTHA